MAGKASSLSKLKQKFVYKTRCFEQEVDVLFGYFKVTCTFYNSFILSVCHKFPSNILLYL